MTQIPDYIEDEEGNRYFLTINKTLDGTWSASYTGWLDVDVVNDDEVDHGQIATQYGGYVNDCVDLNEVYIRLSAKLKRQSIIK